MSAPARKRCAIYTRKSSEEGLEQDFNSLDAQGEACQAFIASQKHEGWTVLSKLYDDGGFSGGSMERPGLERLLADVRAGTIDVVVVYKVDRLTRSLTDFARIVEVFDGKGVSFVSVTQQFNTTSSMGRLTLNVLLSFAQFEREVTAERIRDKIKASKEKGMWMGGLPPLGYDARDKRLIVNKAEAEVVQGLFRLYLEIGSVRRLKEDADRRGIVTKRRRLADGSGVGGKPFSRGNLYALLANPLYLGKVRHRGSQYPGRHEAIVDGETFAAVQAQLATQAPQRVTDQNHSSSHLLTGFLFDESGDRLSPTHAVKKGRRYRYYVSHRLMAARRKGRDGWRLPADEIERLVLDELVRFLRDERRLADLMPGEQQSGIGAIGALLARGAHAAQHLTSGSRDAVRPLLRKLLRRIMVAPDGLTLEFLPQALGAVEADAAQQGEDHDLCAIHIPATLQRRGVEARLVMSNGSGRDRRPDRNLTTLIARAHQCLALLTAGGVKSMEEVGKAVALPASEVSRILPLAFLAPDIVSAILAGKQPTSLTAERMKRFSALPFDWAAQRELLGFSSAQP